MDHELRELRRGYRDELRRAADDPRPDPGGDEEEDEIGACPFDREWCDPSAALDDDGAIPCFSCYLRQDREDGGPNPDVIAARRRD